MQLKDDIEKDIFLAVVAKELEKIKDKEIKETIERKAGVLFALVFDFSNKGLLSDSREMKRRLRDLVEKD